MSAPRRNDPRQMIRVGAVSFFVGVMLILAPLLLGRGPLNRYLVVIGLIAALCGVSLILHGAWDWLHSKN